MASTKILYDYVEHGQNNVPFHNKKKKKYWIFINSYDKFQKDYKYSHPYIRIYHLLAIHPTIMKPWKTLLAVFSETEPPWVKEP